ncbi:amidohydrolase family protein [Ruegeria atlantica]|uniref:amidohydrolase family protein n=1 Tax=Ruegeria atlantica TaxID=81569 RepID=UPI00147ED5B7|nr:amidohydrolase family protein [Ruegeria atlantica]
MIDSHVHFWRLDRGDYHWLTPARTKVYRDFLPGDLLNSDLNGVIAVQAAPTMQESKWLLRQASQHSWIKGVTGWVDLRAPTVANDVIDLRASGNLVGLRPMEAVGNDTWLDASDYQLGLEVVASEELVLEALVLPHHLPAVTRVAQSYPGLPILINHAAKPRLDLFVTWKAAMHDAAACPNVSCKFSGLTAQSMDFAFNQSVFDTIWSAFSSERILWGSDYPVLLETADYDAWVELAFRLTAECSDTEKQAVFETNAMRVYHLQQGEIT